MNNNKTCDDLKYILLQRKGGMTTANIMEQLLIRPYNSNQIAKKLHISYNTASNHCRIMVKFNLVEKKNTPNGTYYYPKENLIREKKSFEEIKKLI